MIYLSRVNYLIRKPIFNLRRKLKCQKRTKKSKKWKTALQNSRLNRNN